MPFWAWHRDKTEPYAPLSPPLRLFKRNTESPWEILFFLTKFVNKLGKSPIKNNFPSPFECHALAL